MVIGIGCALFFLVCIVLLIGSGVKKTDDTMTDRTASFYAVLVIVFVIVAASMCS